MMMPEMEAKASFPATSMVGKSSWGQRCTTNNCPRTGKHLSQADLFKST